MQAQAQEKYDNVIKVKMLTGQLRDMLSILLRSCAQTINFNTLTDTGSLKVMETPNPKFDKQLEDFFALCDQVELNLKTAMECQQQGLSSQRYLPLGVAPYKTEPTSSPDAGMLTYPQFLNTVRSQITYLKEIHDMLADAAQRTNSPE